VDRLLDRFIVIDKQTDGDVVIDEDHKLLTCYFLTFGEFLARVLNYPKVRRFSDGFDSLVIDKMLAKKILQETMEIKLHQQDCTLYKVDRFLMTATRKVKARDLLENSLVEYNESRNSIVGKSFLQYIEQHLDQLAHRNKIISIYL
jgi:hypothetical protein